jgi:N-acetylneuraminic acid mutarotase
VPSPTPEPLQRQEAELPALVEETAAASADGKLYVMGGFNAAGASLDSVYVFDGSGWRSAPRLPLPVDHPSAASLNGQVYLAGGHSNGRTSARLFRLDGDHWTELAAMRYARGGHALVADQGKLYALGGNTSGGNVAVVEAYDPASNTWAGLSPLPMPRNHVSGFVLGNKVCVAGGRSPNTARVDCIDAMDGSWSRLADLPRATSGGGATAFVGGAVVMMGGEDAGESVMVDMLAFYADGSGWSSTDAMRSPRHGFQLAVFQGRAWACGGATAPGLHPVSICTSVANPRRVR